MVSAHPHYLLFCSTHHNSQESRELQQNVAWTPGGKWHFVLEQIDGSSRLEAADSEYSVNSERLALLSVVRGLEAIEQPSQVTLVTTSRYVSRGMQYGLETWREDDYRWERFGERKPIRNDDLWKRVDTALSFHGVTCRLVDSGQNRRAQLQTQLQKVASDDVLPSTEPQVAGPEPYLAELSRERDWAKKAENRINQLERQLAAWTSRHAAASQRPTQSVATHKETWWQLAAFWLKWWRSRFQPKTSSNSSSILAAT